MIKIEGVRKHFDCVGGRLCIRDSAEIRAAVTLEDEPELEERALLLGCRENFEFLEHSKGVRDFDNNSTLHAATCVNLIVSTQQDSLHKEVCEARILEAAYHHCRVRLQYPLVHSLCWRLLRNVQAHLPQTVDISVVVNGTTIVAVIAYIDLRNIVAGDTAAAIANCDAATTITSVEVEVEIETVGGNATCAGGKILVALALHGNGCNG